MGNSACCTPEEGEADEAMIIILPHCLRDSEHERGMDRVSRNLELMNGARDGNAQMVCEALSSGADPEIRQSFVLFSRDQAPKDRNAMHGHIRGPTPLMLSAKSGCVACIQVLVSAGASVHAKDEDGMQPVHYAALSGDIAALECLLSARADPLRRDDNGCGVLEHLPLEVQNDPKRLAQWRTFIRAGEEAKTMWEPATLLQGALDIRACPALRSETGHPADAGK